MKNRELHPQISTGLFFIVLGAALLAVTNDWFGLGNYREYFTWEIALIFIGLLLLVNLKFVGGILLIAGGSWFMIDKFFFEVPEYVKIFYWPAVIILLGLSFIISSIIRKKI